MYNNWNVRSNVTKANRKKKRLGETRNGINYVRCLQQDFAVSFETNHREAKGPIATRARRQGVQRIFSRGQKRDLQKGRGGISGKKCVLGVPSWYPGSGRACPPGILAVGAAILRFQMSVRQSARDGTKMSSELSGLQN